MVGLDNVSEEERFEFCFSGWKCRDLQREVGRPSDQVLVESIVVLWAGDFVLVAGRFTNRKQRKAGSKVERTLLIFDIEST